MLNPRPRRKFKSYLDKHTERNWPSWDGLLGDGRGNVQVYDDDGVIVANKVYVRREGKESGLCEVYNDAVPLLHDLAVRVGKAKAHPQQWRIIGTSTAHPAGADTSVNVQNHADTHEWLAGDALKLNIRAFTNLGVYVTNPETLYVKVFRGYVWTGAAYVLVAHQTVNLTAHVPSTAGKAALVLISIASDGTVAATKGSEVDLSALAITDTPAAPAGTLKRLAAVRVYATQTKIHEDSQGSDIIDLRFATEGKDTPAFTDLTDTFSSYSGLGGEYVKVKADESGLETGAGGGGGGYDYILIRDEKEQNTPGGTFTSGDWRTRDLNTEVADTGNHASLASNQITLAAGSYRARILCPAQHVGGHQARLQNITTGATLLLGTSEVARAGASFDWNDKSIIIGRFTLSSQSVIEVQHKSIGSYTSTGFGRPANISTEIYTVVELWKEP